MIVTSSNCTTLHAIEAAVNASVSGLIISTTNKASTKPLRVRADWKKEVAIPRTLFKFDSSYESNHFTAVLTTSFSFGNVLRNLLASGQEVTLALNASTSMKQDITYNIWADTKTGRDTRVIVVGSHLDSVPAGT